MKTVFYISSLLFLWSCSSESEKNNRIEKIVDEADSLSQDSLAKVSSVHISKKDGLDLFIDSMAKMNYVNDTNRIKQVAAWHEIARSKKEMAKGHLVYRLAFPVEHLAAHFSEPRTYFFAHWNEEDSSFKNGNDFILMSWKIDSLGIIKQKEIFMALHGFMGNFPCYSFISQDRMYSIGHRMTVSYRFAIEMIELLRDFIDEDASVYQYDINLTESKNKPPANGIYRYDIAFSEHDGQSLGEKVTVEINGTAIKVIYEGDGELSNVKKGDLLDSGVLRKHKSGKWIISHGESDVQRDEVGGCSGGPHVIDFARKKFRMC